MALQKTLTHKGMTATDSYIKVDSFQVREAFENPKVNSKKKYDVSVQLGIYTDSAKTYKLEKVPISAANVDENIITFANIYAYVKTLDRFVGAIDA